VRLACAVLVCLGACGGPRAGEPSDAGGDGVSVDGDGGSDASPVLPGEWTTLIEGDWDLPVNDEGYFCVRKTVAATVFVRAFRPVIPLGTHHTVLTIGEPSGPDGIESCSTATNADRMIFGSGVGTNELTMPEGVAIRLQAGDQLLLNLHVYNESTTKPLSGTSGTEVLLVDEARVENEAEVILVGTFGVFIPPHEQPEDTTTIEGRCRMNGDVTVFATGPHMHRLGRHMTVVAETADGDVTLMDRPYSFDEQTTESVGEVAIPTGNAVRVACTYHNDTGDYVSWGESTDEEMCFASLFRYPARASGFICAN
jgi:hypothetical protein